MKHSQAQRLHFSSFVSVLVVTLFCLLSVHEAFAQGNKVKVISGPEGQYLEVDNSPFFIKGMNWDYFPPGTNYAYSLWVQPDDFIKTALDREMSLLKSQGVNAIRVYTGIPAKWITYIYKNFGIYTVLNHSFGRYGLTINGAYVPNTDYASPAVKEILLAEVLQMTRDYKDTPGLLFWLLGNENNYGLFWGGAETEDIPVGETLESVRATYMYRLFNEAMVEMKKIDSSHPLAIANGDNLFIEIIAKEMPALDIFGTNMYRGTSFRDAFEVVKEKLNKPIFMTEFGADAFNAKLVQEDQVSQAMYALENWKELYMNVSGKGLSGNSLGGLYFQFSDGWWKYGQESELDIQNPTASWANGGYKEDFVEGQNNMNEEWFGICAKGMTDPTGHYELYPRAAFYTIKDIFTLNPYTSSKADLSAAFASFDLGNHIREARKDKTALEVTKGSKIRLSAIRLDFETVNTGGSLISTPAVAKAGSDSKPAFLGFDHLQSFYADVVAQPTENIRATASVNILGNVPQNPIDEIFYENRGLAKTIQTETGAVSFADNERIKLYKASLSWDSPWFMLNGFYRTGHYHWGYEGDFFGFYPEANYGINADIYNASAPLGFEVTGKRAATGLKIAFGPELWWGANPAILIKYQFTFAGVKATAVYHDDIAKQGAAVSSFAVPLPPTRKASLHLEYSYHGIGIELGGIWGGSTKVGETFQLVSGNPGNYSVLQDKIKNSDTYGGKIKLTASFGGFHWYAQGAAMGLVADGGVNPTVTFTGWRLKDAGTGNQYNVLTGVAYNIGDWQIAPNFLWQKPIEGPVPSAVPSPGRPRNVLSDPFAVRGNRETTAGELMITYDPTPITWLFAWDNDIREDAPLAFSVDFVYRHQPTTKDAAIGILADGRTLFAFPGSPEGRDVWEVNTRILSKLSREFGLIANLYGGTGEPNGSDDRLIYRYGGDIRVIYGTFKVIGSLKLNDWGPYDYHRDFNLTYPFQSMLDFSYMPGAPGWFNLPQTQIGIRGIWRTLDRYSNRYAPSYRLNEVGNLIPDVLSPGQKKGTEWEVRTYLRFTM